MTSRYARKVDNNQAEIVAALRAAGCRVVDFSWCGRGVPDLHVVNPRGLLFWLEVKRPRKANSRAKDDRTDAELEMATLIPIAVVRSANEALEAVGMVTA